MSSTAVVSMVNSVPLVDRIRVRAVVAGKDIGWATDNRYRLCTTAGWDTAWSTAAAQMPTAPADFIAALGYREDVITDAMIDAAIQGLQA